LLVDDDLASSFTSSSDLGLPVLGANGVYVVDSPGNNFASGITVQDYFYWVQLEVQQASPATAETRNAVILVFRTFVVCLSGRI